LAEAGAGFLIAGDGAVGLLFRKMVDHIRKLLRAQPFEPFTIVMSSGQRHFVASHEHASMHPRENRVFIAFDDDSSVTVSTLHITAVEEGRSEAETIAGPR
jgi:hypothetical protein